MKNKILVFCLDALCSRDLEEMRQMPHFSQVLNQGAQVTSVLPVYPSLTYPCHVSILTGTYVDKHHLPHNEQVSVFDPNPPWYNQKSDITGKNLLDYAKEHGYTTASLSWPVSGGANYDYNMPMIVPYSYNGYHPEKWLIGNATDNLMEAYFWKYGRFIKGRDRSLDLYTMAIAPDLIRDFGQPDVMLIKMCDLDSARHAYGVSHPLVSEQLRKHDEEFGVILETVKRYGDYDNTNFIILGDHGQSDVDHVLNLNILLRQNGFIKVDEEGKITDYTAYAHSAALSCWVEVKDPEKDNEKVYEFLKQIKADPKYGIGYLFTKKEVQEQYHLSGPFEFVLEGDKPISFGNTYLGDDVFADAVVGDYKTAKASHGSLPFKKETTCFAASGPAFKKGAVLQEGNMVDEAPTMAKVLGFTMPDVDGRVWDEILKEE